MGAGEKRSKVIDWVGREILPNETDVRAWLRRTLAPDDLEDVIQEAYCRIAGLDDVSHIRSGRAYLFTTARMVVLEHLRRSRVVRIDTVAEIDGLNISAEDPSPERVVSARSELARVKGMIDKLPERCRRIFEMRKIQGLPQRAVAEALGITENIVENEVARGLRIILKEVAEGEPGQDGIVKRVKRNGKARNSQ